MVDRYELPALQVLEQLPEGLAVAVLAAAPLELDFQLSMLPIHLHPLAVEAAFPSIRQDHYLSLDFNLMSWRNPACVYEALHAAITSTRPLQKLSVQGIPECSNACLFQLILVACISASDVSLDYHFCCSQQVPLMRHFEQLRKVLCQNSSLSSLEVTCGGRPWESESFNGLLEALTNLHSLSFGMEVPDADSNSVSVPQCIVALKRLTSLRLCQGLNLTDLPEIVPHLTKLRELQLSGVNKHQQLLCLASLTGLQALELQDCHRLSSSPPP
jgi:hypothetical protein